MSVKFLALPTNRKGVLCKLLLVNYRFASSTLRIIDGYSVVYVALFESFKEPFVKLFKTNQILHSLQA